jgi:hypothetical protein
MVGVFALSAPLYAAPVLDQQHIVAPASAYQSFSTTYDPLRVAQTLTVGVTGTLTQVDIEYYGNSNLIGLFNILSTSGGVPSSTVIGTGSLSGNTLPVGGNQGWVSFKISLAVTAGDVIAIEPAITNIGAGWALDPGGYAGGSGYISHTYIGSPASFAIESADLGFRTFVEAAATPAPEPATWALLVGGFGIVGGTMRRRRLGTASA